MDDRERVQLRENCLIAYRHTDQGIEFCLISQAAGSRWEFPKAESNGENAAQGELLSQAAAAAGLGGKWQGDNPLDAFVAARGNEARHTTAYLMQVTHVDDVWPRQDTHRRLWCLPEEARVRLRRKPLRRFIDLALRSLDGTSGAADHRTSANSLPNRPR
jgi:hypothetical protein